MAYAEPELRIDHDPKPHLRMRPKRHAAVVREPEVRPAIAAPAAAPDDYDAAPVRDVGERVSVRVNLGYLVDGTSITGKPTLGGRFPDPNFDFATIRSYGFGELSLSTRGVVASSLSSYFAGAFQIANQQTLPDPTNPAARNGVVATPPPIATWFDRSGIVPRAAWIEAKDFTVPQLAPLRVRAGELYVYGPWVMHVNGGLVGWDSRLVTASIFGGQRVPDYILPENQPRDAPALFGASLRVDLRGMQRPIPLAIGAATLLFSSAPGQPPSQHAQVDADWRPSRDTALVADARTLDGQPASEHVQFRTSYRTVTSLVLDVTHRHAADWRWDPAVIHPAIDDPTAPRSYLELGPVIPELFAALRGGTLLFDNVDLLARIATGIDLSGSNDPKSSFSASYLEGGGALEVRVRRTLAIGASILSRQTARHDPLSNQILDPMNGVAQPLPAQTAIGDRGFIEAGTLARMSLGARKFSALVEVYGRRTQYALDYCLPGKCGVEDTGIPSIDWRGGARFSVDAWIRDRLRLYASYDVSTALSFAPETTGYRSLKLLMEGRY
jgi:hypothetical protein